MSVIDGRTIDDRKKSLPSLNDSAAQTNRAPTGMSQVPTLLSRKRGKELTPTSPARSKKLLLRPPAEHLAATVEGEATRAVAGSDTEETKGPIRRQRRRGDNSTTT